MLADDGSGECKSLVNLEVQEVFLFLTILSSHMQLMAGHVCNLIINIVLCELIQIH